MWEWVQKKQTWKVLDFTPCKSKNLGVEENFFYKNKKNGNGTEITKVGETYFGEWKNNSWNGIGRFKNKFGVLHEGTFINGKMNGDCIVTDNYNSKLSISYKENMPHGVGI